MAKGRASKNGNTTYLSGRMWFFPGLNVARGSLLAGIFAALLGAGSSSSSAQDAESAPAQKEPNPSGMFHGSGPLLPNAALPKHIPASQGKLTLFADYPAAGPRGVPLFLVNRTTAPVILPSQDGDIYLKLEGQGPTGAWERAQSHIGATCGNSYGSVTLPPGQFLQLRGYAASQGQKVRVRYSCHGGARIISNEGEGLIAAEDVADARDDFMALSPIPEAIVNLLSRDEPRGTAQIASPASRVAALRLLQCYIDSPKLKKDARALASQLVGSPKPAPEDARAAAAIDSILKGPWPAQPSTEALIQRCEQALMNAKTGVPGVEFGAPETEPALLWAVLADLAAREFGSGRFRLSSAENPNPARWKPIMAKAFVALDRGSAQERRAIAALLAIEPLVDETLADESFEIALFVPDSAIQRVCADTLSRRMRWSRLAELGWQLPPEGQLAVFKALACPPSRDPLNPDGRTRRDPGYTGEDKFWSHCLKTQMLQAVSELRIYSRNEGGFNRTVHDPLHHYLLAAADRSDAATSDFYLGNEGYMFAGAVDFLAGWNMEEDQEVFTRLLKYRGYVRQEGARGEPLRPYVLHRYVVRDIARRALLKQGKPVPEGIEIEKDVTGTAAAQLSTAVEK